MISGLTYLLCLVHALQIGGAVSPHDGQCHLHRVTNGGETYYEYDDLRLVRTHCHYSIHKLH